MSNTETASPPAKTTPVKKERSITPRKTGIVRKPLIDGQAQGCVTFKDAQADVKEPSTTPTKACEVKQDPAPKVPQMEVGGQLFERDRVCIPCNYTKNDETVFDSDGLAIHLVTTTHATSLADFKELLGAELPTHVATILNAMEAATASLTRDNPYAFLKLMKKKKAENDARPMSCSSDALPKASSLSSLPSPSQHHESDREIDVSEYCREQLTIKDNRARRIMTLADWARFHSIAKRDGLDAALNEYQGHLVCKPCDKSLPYDAQLLEHLGSTDHKNEMRRYLRERDPNAVVQGRNWARESKTPIRIKKRSNYQSGSRGDNSRAVKRPAASTSANRERTNSNRVGWPCLDTTCRHICMANKGAKAYTCPDCGLTQRPM